MSRVRELARHRKKEVKAIAETVLRDTTDKRPYVKVEIDGIPVEGLLDSGASISCLGSISDV